MIIDENKCFARLQIIKSLENHIMTFDRWIRADIKLVDDGDIRCIDIIFGFFGDVDDGFIFFFLFYTSYSLTYRL